ncbi:hypothetical protein [Legionella gresilensis]|uniref:hypothetical protein n=1 Tax=Legionella gresilensis TaxID=91823 RepID=UPI0010417E2E|nr:hypothetical protein [Legionella gresilensis]
MLIKKFKKALYKTPINYALLVKESNEVIEQLAYDPLTEVFKNPYFIELKNIHNKMNKISLNAQHFYNSLSLEQKGKVYYFTALDIIDSLLGFKNVGWKIQDGFAGLQDALRKNGQIIFQGKYGASFHLENSLFIHKKESTNSREVCFFRKNSMSPKAFLGSWTHCVVVDQAKIIDGTPFVFFRDPNDPSIPGLPERVYMLNYENFVARISNKYSSPREANQTYGTALTSLMSTS